MVGAICGYAAAAPSVGAQNPSATRIASVVNVGDDLSLRFERGTYNEGSYSLRCTVADVQGIWIQCAGDRFATQREENWYNLDRVIHISKREK